MKCPLCNKPMAQTQNPEFWVCKTPGCYNRFICDVDRSLRKLRKQIADIRAEAVKRAFQQRRCKTCGLFPAGKCQYALVAHPNFGCVNWQKKGTK